MQPFNDSLLIENSTVKQSLLPSGQTVLKIESKLATASISLFGGQVLTWQPKEEEAPVLWLSPSAKYDGNTAIRGGVPICWPWFGKHPSEPSTPSHGYARLCTWNLDRIVTLDDGCVELMLSLPESTQVSGNRVAGLHLSARIVIGATLVVELTTLNRSAEPIRITEGLHTYFYVGDVESIQVNGLDGAEYVDLTNDNQRQCQAGTIKFSGEVGRIFVSCDSPTVIEDRSLGRAIHITGTGSQSIAVWNPGEAVASKMSDLGSKAWRNMVCVETANALENELLLQPGQSHTMAAIYAVSKLA